MVLCLPMKLVSLLVAALLAGCGATPGIVRGSEGNPIVTVTAGTAEVSATGDGWHMWYVIDTRTQTCWLKLGDAGAAMDCCDLRRVPEAARYITWKTDASCAAAASPQVKGSEPEGS